MVITLFVFVGFLQQTDMYLLDVLTNASCLPNIFICFLCFLSHPFRLSYLLSFVAVGRRSCEHQKSDLHASSLTGIATRRYHVDCRVDGSSHRIFSSFLVKYQNITLVSEPQRFQKKYCVFCCCSLDSILWIEFFFFD